MTEVIAGLLILCGGVFALIASIGLLRLPDVLTRMHASTKAGTLASALILVAVAIVFPGISTITKSVAAVLFLMLTAPLAAHMLGRSAVDDEERLRK